MRRIVVQAFILVILVAALKLLLELIIINDSRGVKQAPFRTNSKFIKESDHHEYAVHGSEVARRSMRVGVLRREPDTETLDLEIPKEQKELRKHYYSFNKTINRLPTPTTTMATSSFKPDFQRDTNEKPSTDITQQSSPDSKVMEDPDETFNDEDFKETEFECAIPVEKSGVTGGGCKLPVLDPFHPNVMKHVEKTPAIQCPGRLYTTYENGVIQIDKQAFVKDNIEEISVVAVHRPDGMDPDYTGPDYDYTLENVGILNLNNTKENSSYDFVEIQTRRLDGRVQTNLHASVVEKPDVLKRTQSKDAPLNIMILAFDSMSAANFERMMPLTYKYLKDDLKTFLFKGFSIVGQATTPALSAMLTGLSIDENCERQEGRRGMEGAKQIDGWPFIFKEYKQQGFATMWSEDDPMLGTFHMRLLGFAEPPADHYARSMWYAHERAHLCFGSQPQFEIQLKYLKSFMKSYKGRRKFGFTFLSDLCHVTMSRVGGADKGVASFLKSLHDEHLLDNTMFIVMGDHGPRFAQSRTTTQGKLEESLPFLSVHFPEWFKSKYKLQMKHFQRNTDILISPFDLHATFLHLSNFPAGSKSNSSAHGSSLFKPLSRDRTCAEARVPEHFCPCLERRNISTNHVHIIEGAKTAVHEINRRLRNDSAGSKLCKKVQFVRVLSAVQVMSSKKLQTFHSILGGDSIGIGETVFDEMYSSSDCSYEFQFSARPGGGVFETTITVNKDSGIHVSPMILRINAYGDLPRCIEDKNPRLRDFCVCHDR